MSPEAKAARQIRTEGRDPEIGRQNKHANAVAQSLCWADDAALRGDHADALGWLDAVDAVCGGLPAEYERKRGAWIKAVGR
jgi:hypothetical protein